MSLKRHLFVASQEASSSLSEAAGHAVVLLKLCAVENVATSKRCTRRLDMKP
jgi:hypothetical protein